MRALVVHRHLAVGRWSYTVLCAGCRYEGEAQSRKGSGWAAANVLEIMAARGMR